MVSGIASYHVPGVQGPEGSGRPDTRQQRDSGSGLSHAARPVDIRGLGIAADEKSSGPALHTGASAAKSALATYTLSPRTLPDSVARIPLDPPAPTPARMQKASAAYARMNGEKGLALWGTGISISI